MLLAVACATAAGCGGTDGAPTPTVDPREAAATFVREAQDVCRDLRRGLFRLSRAKSSPADVLRRAIAVESDGLDRIDALAAPPAQRAAYAELRAALAARHAARAAQLGALRTGDDDALVAALERESRQTTVATRLARRMGLDGCPGY